MDEQDLSAGELEPKVEPEEESGKELGIREILVLNIVVEEGSKLSRDIVKENSHLCPPLSSFHPFHPI